MEFSNYIISDSVSVYDAMTAIDKGGKGIAFTCDGLKLLGVVTDGIIRRYILRGGSLSEPVGKIANHNPIVLNNASLSDGGKVLREHKISALPVVDDSGCITSIEFAADDRLYRNRLYQNSKLNIPVVIMAGGKGTRLQPFTAVLPKPLIPIGEKTISEHIISRFGAFECNDITMIVNYKKQMIRAYFSEQGGRDNIKFVEETEFLGTGGGLSLLREQIHGTFFLTNCDILVDANYSDILRVHKESGNIITIVSAVKKAVIPYGTIELDENGQIMSLREKPEYSFITNTGFYIIEPEFIDLIPDGKSLPITDVIQECIDRGLKTGIYPISENAWLDMGTHEEMERMVQMLSTGDN